MRKQRSNMEEILNYTQQMCATIGGGTLARQLHNHIFKKTVFLHRSQVWFNG